MIDKQNDLLIQIEERYGDTCLNDSNRKTKKSNRRPQGFVEIFEILESGEKKIVGKSNLIGYLGRETLAQLLTNIDNPNVVSGVNERLYWFGLGDGGTDPADPFNPFPPTNSDIDLINAIPINATDSTCGDFHALDSAYYKHPFDSVTHDQDTANDDRWLILKIITTISSDDANGYQLSEAGLFTAESGAPGYSPGSSNFHLFARVTFPVIIKTIQRGFTFVWYLYM